MEIANCTVAVGGHNTNTVQKFGVTAAEVSVLELIHGSGSVTGIEITGRISRSDREERGRLQAIYGKPEGSREQSAVDALFPGAAARVFHDFDELEMPDGAYSVETRDKRDARLAAAGKKAKADAKEAKKNEEDGSGIEELEDSAEAKANKDRERREMAEVDPKAASRKALKDDTAASVTHSSVDAFGDDAADDMQSSAVDPNRVKNAEKTGKDAAKAGAKNDKGPGTARTANDATTVLDNRASEAIGEEMPDAHLFK